MKIQEGFHLIELLVTLAIVAILASVGISRYTHYVTDANRLQAQQGLAQLNIALQEYQIENNSYAGATLKNLHFSDQFAEKHYRFSIQPTDTYYLLSAIPIGTQAERDRCGTITLDSTGKKGAGKQDCWG